MTYKEYKKQRQESFNQLPIFVTFHQGKLNSWVEEIKPFKPISLGNSSFISSEFLPQLEEHSKKWDSIILEKMQEKDFLKDAFKYEMSNHEYSYTLEPEDTLVALGFKNLEQLNKIELEAWKEAKKEYLAKINF